MPGQKWGTDFNLRSSEAIVRRATIRSAKAPAKAKNNGKAPKAATSRSRTAKRFEKYGSKSSRSGSKWSRKAGSQSVV